jgi:hypothetical protein
MIIGVSGKARSGKDEVANILCKTYGFKQVSFAKKLKELLITYFGVSEEDLVIKNKATRSLLQSVGQMTREGIEEYSESKDKLSTVIKFATKYFGIDPKDLDNNRKSKSKKIVDKVKEYWEKQIDEFIKISDNVSTDIWVNYALKNLDAKEYYVVSDVRYLNEKKAIEKIGGKVVRVERVDKPAIEIGDTHESETDLDNVEEWYAKIINHHTADWQEHLELAVGNLIRKCIRDNVELDYNRFMIKVVNR